MNINKKIRIFKKPSVCITWKQIYIAVTVVISLIAVIAALLAVMRFVRVGDILVKGDNPYDRVDIIETLAIRRDSFWWAIDEDELEEKLVAERQLIEKVSVEKKFPNRIVVNVVESRKPKWYIEVSDRKYTLDERLYVIEETKETEGVARLTLPNVTKLFEREVPSFGQSESEIKRTLEIIYAVNESNIRSRISALDVSDPNKILIEIDGGKYRAELGNKTDIEGKLEMVKNTLATEQVENSNGGIIYADTYSQDEYVSFRPYDSTTAPK